VQCSAFSSNSSILSVPEDYPVAPCYLFIYSVIHFYITEFTLFENHTLMGSVWHDICVS